MKPQIRNDYAFGIINEENLKAYQKLSSYSPWEPDEVVAPAQDVKIEESEKTQMLTLKLMVNAYYEYQDMRKRLGNKLKLKKTGEKQKMPDNQVYVITQRGHDLLLENMREMIKKEAAIKKLIEKELLLYPIHEWLRSIKGIDTIMSAAIISQFDINKATTVSKMWQFAGLNPGLVRGQVCVKIKGKKEPENVIRRYTGKDGDECAVVLSDEMIRGDRLAPGFCAPFNQWLRAKLCGVLATSFLMSRSPYSEFYYNEKRRLENREGWKDERPGHRDRAAKRKMVKQFLVDLYVQWRTISGLPVRKPYAEEYLGRVHEG